jgi:hypothetical protein
MQEFSSGAGMAALGFWLFVAIVVAAGVWDNIRKREAQHETLRRVIESGQRIDDELTDKLLSLTSGNQNLERDLKVGGLITLFTAPGLAIMGWIMEIFLAEELFGVLLAVSAMVMFVAVGLLVAAYVVQRWYGDSKYLEMD